MPPVGHGHCRCTVANSARRSRWYSTRRAPSARVCEWAGRPDCGPWPWPRLRSHLRWRPRRVATRMVVVGVWMGESLWALGNLGAAQARMVRAASVLRAADDDRTRITVLAGLADELESGSLSRASLLPAHATARRRSEALAPAGSLHRLAMERYAATLADDHPSVASLPGVTGDSPDRGAVSFAVRTRERRSCQAPGKPTSAGDCRNSRGFGPAARSVSPRTRTDAPGLARPWHGCGGARAPAPGSALARRAGSGAGELRNPLQGNCLARIGLRGDHSPIPSDL